MWYYTLFIIQDLFDHEWKGYDYGASFTFYLMHKEIAAGIPAGEIIENYKIIIEDTINKYPYTPTKKPAELEKEHITSIPKWVKQIAKWWSQKQIEDTEFVSALHYLINNKMIYLFLNLEFLQSYF